jgi:pimeloyl-ACP methyl ester carboxylesterase
MSRLLLLFLMVTSVSAWAEFSREYLDQQPLEVAPANGISVAYRSLGNPEQPAVVMIMGLGASHVVWGDALVQGLEASGYRVVLLDNRDTGGSTRFDDWGQPTVWWQLLKRQMGFEVDAPYTLNDMAADTVAVMDVLDINNAHIVGASMGGMIAQVVAARHPQRTRSLVSIMSTTGSPQLPPPSAEASESLLGVTTDDGAAAERREAMVARGFYPQSMGRQMMAVFKTGDRSDAVATITAPTLVVHGAEDALLPPPHGAHTAQLIAGSELVVYDSMGHNIPDDVLPKLLQKMTLHMQAADRAAMTR